MSNRRYTPEFKDEAVRQVLERGYGVIKTQVHPSIVKYLDDVLESAA